MDLFFQLTLAGLAIGAIYSCVALAVVMIYQATDHFNFAQGEMAMFSTFIAWTFLGIGLPVWIAFILAVGFSFLAGIIIERTVIKPVENAPIFNQIIVFIGLLVIFNNVAGWLWEFTIKPFPSLFPEDLGFKSDLIGPHHMGVIALTLLVLFMIFCFFRFTRVGLAMRAAAANPDSAKLVGVSVGWMLALGWGLAAAVGAVGGILVAPIVYLEPNMMSGVLLYGFAGALLGGVSSPGGAVLGGLIVGVMENWVGQYVPGGSELKLTFALVLIVAVLLFKPAGLFGRVVIKRVSRNYGSSQSRHADPDDRLCRRLGLRHHPAPSGTRFYRLSVYAGDGLGYRDAGTEHSHRLQRPVLCRSQRLLRHGRLYGSDIHRALRLGTL